MQRERVGRGLDRHAAAEALPTQASIANGQRAAKRQPATAFVMFGTVPSMAARRAGARRAAASSRAGRPCRDAAGSEELVDRRALHDLAGIHHHDLVADLRDDAEIVGDQHDRGAAFVLQLAHQLEDLRLDRDVERCRRLVGDQELRIAGERHRDHHALAHAAGELVRIFVEPRSGEGMRTRRSISMARSRACRREPSRWRRMVSVIWSPTVMTG